MLGIEDNIEAQASIIVACEAALILRATLLALADRK